MFFKKSLIVYVTYADPTPDISERVIETCFDSGADVVEIGLPFSDPIADGPVIQASHQRALVHSPTIDQVFQLVSRVKKKYAKPLVLMGAVNLIYHYGIAKFFSEAQAHGVDGVIMPDLPVEDADDYVTASKKFQVPIIFLVSPLCRPVRLEALVKASEGFVYLVSSTGTTGERETLSRPLSALVAQIKAVKDIPVAIGFGIGTGEQVRKVHEIAEGAIVGSALARVIGGYDGDVDGLLENVRVCVGGLKTT